MKIYVIGSLMQVREIMLIANALSAIKDNEVRSVNFCKELTLEECIPYEKVYGEKQCKEIIYVGEGINYD